MENGRRSGERGPSRAAEGNAIRDPDLDATVNSEAQRERRRVMAVAEGTTLPWMRVDTWQ